jgi:hypothetical protein
MFSTWPKNGLPNLGLEIRLSALLYAGGLTAPGSERSKDWWKCS